MINTNNPKRLLIQNLVHYTRGRSRISSQGGGAHLYKLHRVEGGANNFRVFRVKNHDFTQKNHIFTNFRGGHMPGASPPLDLPLYTSVISRAFNIFQVCQYFTIYRQYFLLKFEKNVHEYLIQHSLKSEGTKDHFRRVNVPGTTPVLKGLHYGNH